jgi:AraC-like DNA-binding protein
MKEFSKIEKWALRLNPDLLGHEKDFLVWDYLANSPRDMITKFKELPFVDHDDASQLIKAQTPFIDIATYYREVTEDLFMIYSEAEYKANICFKHNYIKEKPSEHYCLSLRVHSYFKTVNSLVNGVGYSDNSWLIFKPGAKVSHHHFKGTKGRYISIYFTQHWLDSFIRNNEDVSGVLLAFMNSDKDYLICPYFQESALLNTDTLFDLLVNGKPNEEEHMKKVEEEICTFFSFFKSKMLEEQITERHFRVNNLERMKVLHAEQILRAHTFSKFPGIGYLAKEAGLSETKLKECFRVVYNKTLSQYLHEIQMKKAKELLTSNLQIAHIAQQLSYENPSKFSAAFRKYHTVLPSDIKRS